MTSALAERCYITAIVGFISCTDGRCFGGRLKDFDIDQEFNVVLVHLVKL